jgi:hypothetical protein
LLGLIDSTGILQNIRSEEYYAYTPLWGRLTKEQVETCDSIIATIERCLQKEKHSVYVKNLKWLKANYEFTLLLDETGRAMEAAWNLRNDLLSGKAIKISPEQYRKARSEFDKIPVARLFKVYTSRVRSRGELGVLSSINQRLWGEYNLLNQFLSQRSF